MREVKNLSIITIILLIGIAGDNSLTAQSARAFQTSESSPFIFSSSGIQTLQSVFDIKYPSFDISADREFPKCKNNYLQMYHQQLGIFCKAENQIQAVASFPFKFRLGSVQYVDWLESKPNSSFSFR